MDKIYVLVLNWNGEKDTIDCLESLAKSAKIKDAQVKLVVVDNASKEENFTILDKYLKDKNIHLIKNSKNLGFAGGNNVGIKYALKNGADYIMVLNNDTEVAPNMIHELYKAIKQNKSIAVVAPKIYFAKGYEYHDKYKKSELGKVIWYAGGKIDWNNVYGSNKGVDEVDRGQYDNFIETDFATGACSLFRAQYLQKFGDFDERYFAYLEDLEISVRFSKKRLKIMYVPSAHLWHKVSQSSSIGSDLNDYYITRNRLLFGMRYATLRTKIALFRESLRFYLSGRKWQKIGVIDFYFGKFGKGSYGSKN